jgi:hypothetical protein
MVRIRPSTAFNIDTLTLLIFHSEREKVAFTSDVRFEFFRNCACWTRKSIRRR